MSSYDFYVKIDALPPIEIFRFDLLFNCEFECYIDNIYFKLVSIWNDCHGDKALVSKDTNF